MNKKTARLRRAKKGRANIRRLHKPKLCVHRTAKHIYAQVISPAGDIVMASASTVEKVFKQANDKSGNIKAASAVGKLIAERALKANIKKLAFDRSGFKYHGRIKALAEAAREGGLEL